MRIKEGADLGAELLERAATVGRLNDEVRSLAPAAMEAGRERFLERLRQFFADKGCDDSKLMQEAAGVAEKADITEETSRTKNHVEHMKQILQNGGTVGRKLDFLLQELNREANTIASKTDDYRISELVMVEGITFSVSYTTRAPRPDEVEGNDYFLSAKTSFAKWSKPGSSPSGPKSTGTFTARQKRGSTRPLTGVWTYCWT
jgi:hypothetical protein